MPGVYPDHARDDGTADPRVKRAIQNVARQGRPNRDALITFGSLGKEYGV